MNTDPVDTQRCFNVYERRIGVLQTLKRCRVSTREKAVKQPPEVFYKKAVLKNFAIFTGKHLSWNLFL